MLPKKLQRLRERIRIRRNKSEYAATTPGRSQPTVPQKSDASAPTAHSNRSGKRGEDMALAFLSQQNMHCLERNWRSAGRYGTEIDLIMQDAKTLVFVEVKLRKSTHYGGAGGSISRNKQQKIIRAAQHYLQRFGTQPPPCRFDTVLIHSAQPAHKQPEIEWLRGAFCAD